MRTLAGGEGLETTSNGDRPTATVVVPAFNEAGHLEESLSQIHAALVDLTDAYDWDLLIVDDGSADRTLEIARRFAERNQRVSVVAHRTNLGLGSALKTAFRHARGSYIITCDADLSYSTDHIRLLLDTITTTG